MHATDIVGYTHNGEAYCPQHGSELDDAHPVFASDEFGTHACGVCFEPVDASWGASQVNYAISLLRDAVASDRDEYYPRDYEYTDYLAEHLEWCGLDEYQERVLLLYTERRAQQGE